MYQAAKPRLMLPLCYINGIEIPIKGASVSYGVWTPPTASVELVPDVTMRDIGHEDRVRVTLFYLDTHRAELNKSAPQWRLLFDGEIQRVSFSASKGQTSMTIQCADLINGLQHMRMFFLMSISNLVTQNVTAGIPDNPNSAITGHHFAPTFPASLFFQGLDPLKNTPIRRPYDLIENMFRALVSGNDFPDQVRQELSKALGREVTPAEAKSTTSMHWFARWARRSEFMRRFSPLPVFEDYNDKTGVFPILRAIQNQHVIDSIRQLAERVNDAGSLYDLIQQLFTTMYYELQMLPTAPLVRQDYLTGRVLGPMEPGKQLQKVTPYDRRSLRLLQNVSKPQVLFGVAPACNVFWPSTITSFNISRDMSQQPTRLVISEGNLFTVLNGGPPEQNQTEFINAAMAVAYPPIAQEQLDRRLGRAGYTRNVLANPHNYLVFPEEFFRGPHYATRPIPPWFMYLQHAAPVPEDGTPPEAAPVDTGPPISDRYESIRARGRDLIERELAHYAQQTSAVARFRHARLLELQRRLEATPTEPNAEVDNIELGRRWLAVAQLLYGTSDEENPERWPNVVGMLSDIDALRAQTNDLLDKQPAYQLYAAYEYYRAKYQLTAGSVSTVFDPYKIPGYPAIIFDRLTTQQHQMCYITNVEHSFSPGSAGTTSGVSFARSFSEFFQSLYTWRNREDGRVDSSIQIKASTELAGEALPAAMYAVVRAADDEKLSEEQYLKAVETARAANEADIRSLSPADQAAERTRFNVLEGRARSARLGGVRDLLDAVPPNPIPEIRRSFQTNREADLVYLASIYANDRGQVPVETHLDVNGIEAYDVRTGKTLIKDQINTRDFIEQAVGFRPAESHKVFANSTDDAMRYVSRPICTLDEWISLHERGVRQREVRPDDPNEGKYATYYVKILDLVPGPGPRPAMSETGDVLSAVEVDTRYNWEQLLLRYRERAYYELAPKEV